MDRDVDKVAIAGERLVDRVIDDFENHVVEAGPVVGVADVHAGTLANGLESFQDLDFTGVVRIGHGVPKAKTGVASALDEGVESIINYSS